MKLFQFRFRVFKFTIADSNHDESMVPTDAPVSSFGTEEVGTNLQNDLPQDFAPSSDSEPQAAGFRDSVPAVLTPEGLLSPPPHKQAGENQVHFCVHFSEFKRMVLM